MDPESKRLLEETLELTQENNKMLHKVRSIQKWATFWSLLKVFLVIGIALGSFYFLEPYIDQLMNVYSGASEALKMFQN